MKPWKIPTLLVIGVLASYAFILFRALTVQQSCAITYASTTGNTLDLLGLGAIWLLIFGLIAYFWASEKVIVEKNP